MDLHLEHAQLSGHVDLLQSSILRAKMVSLIKQLCDLCPRLCRLLHREILLGYDLPLNQWKILSTEHLCELLPSQYGLFHNRTSTGHQLLAILLPQEKNIQGELDLLVL